MDLPCTDDPDTRGFWDAARRHEIAMCRCDLCQQVVHPPRDHCPRCHARSTSWHDVAPTGRLFSFTVQEHQLDPEVEVPYTIVLVELDDAPEVRLAGSLPGRPDLVVGQPMRARFDDLTEDIVLPQWEPAPSTEGSTEPASTAR
jgi:uncharacterized OB-fold protein